MRFLHWIQLIIHCCITLIHWYVGWYIDKLIHTLIALHWLNYVDATLPWWILFEASLDIGMMNFVNKPGEKIQSCFIIKNRFHNLLFISTKNAFSGGYLNLENISPERPKGQSAPESAPINNRKLIAGLSSYFNEFVILGRLNRNCKITCKIYW